MKYRILIVILLLCLFNTFISKYNNREVLSDILNLRNWYNITFLSYYVSLFCWTEAVWWHVTGHCLGFRSIERSIRRRLTLSTEIDEPYFLKYLVMYRRRICCCLCCCCRCCCCCWWWWYKKYKQTCPITSELAVLKYVPCILYSLLSRPTNRQYVCI